MSEEVDAQFEQAKEDSVKLSKAPENDVKLKMYGLFKQATAGDYTNGKKPGLMDIAGKFKYEAWKLNEGMSQDGAKQAYVDLVKELQAADAG
ncbi:MAG: acyl-CoA-binding protein [Nitrospiraceae bacterium]|nr:acyl-CoA-binding protein [Nitrospiraceae bacterium]